MLCIEDWVAPIWQSHKPVLYGWLYGLCPYHIRLVAEGLVFYALHRRLVAEGLVFYALHRRLVAEGLVFYALHRRMVAEGLVFYALHRRLVAEGLLGLIEPTTPVLTPGRDMAEP
jgi:hypothetical protein